jgi:hypothetical protein
MSNPLKGILPGDVRRVAYIVMSTVGLGLTFLNAGFAATGDALPKWLIFVSAGYVAVSGPGFAMAGSNVRNDPS